MDRRTLRTRKVSQRMAVVDESERKQAMAARLEALENDVAAQDTFAAGSDDEEFVLRDVSDGDEEEEEVIGSKKKRKKSRVGGGMRKTRGMIAGGGSKGAKVFREWLDDAELDRLPEGEPTYLTAMVGEPRTRSARKLCSVCGDRSSYTCTRCGAKYCCIRCYGVHTDTRCLKFMA